MKKIRLSIILLLGNIGGSILFADYEIKIDTVDKKVYLVSGDVRISVDNINQYFTGTTTSVDNSSTSSNTTGDVSIIQNNENSGIGSVFSETVLKELGSGTELEKAIYWMYQNGLTMYDTVITYRPKDFVTREEAAKLIGQLFEVLKFEKTDKGFNCNFVDAIKFDPTLSDYIQKVCTWGIFRGNDKTQEYMPHDHLSKAQILTVLIRILEGKMSNENADPWWIEYYIKAKMLELTKEIVLLNLEKASTREEVALLIYRFKNLVIDERKFEVIDSLLKEIAGSSNGGTQSQNFKEYEKLIDDVLKEWSKISGKELGNVGNSSGTNNSQSTGGDTSSGGIVGDLDIIAGGVGLLDHPEFNEAVRWMYDVGITNYSTPATYLPFQTITREQVAKMLDKFAIATNLTTIRNTSSCTFSDVAQSSEFYYHIRNICQYGVVNGFNGKFNPQQIVTKAEFIAMLIRLFEGVSLDENVQPRWSNYFKKAVELSLISAQDTVTFSNSIARYEVALFLYRLKVRWTMYNNLNTSILIDEIVKTLEDTSIGAKKSAKISVDILSLNNIAFTDGYAEIFEERYKVKKSILNSYNVGTNSFVWYGDLISLETDQVKGSLTVIMTNGVLSEGTVRLFDSKKSYYISKDMVTTSYYWLKEI